MNSFTVKVALVAIVTTLAGLMGTAQAEELPRTFSIWDKNPLHQNETSRTVRRPLEPAKGLSAIIVDDRVYKPSVYKPYAYSKPVKKKHLENRRVKKAYPYHPPYYGSRVKKFGGKGIGGGLVVKKF
ncbi:MAG: hypothetical protein AAGA63_14560 [Pseudomonadota bacterium]